MLEKITEKISAAVPLSREDGLFLLDPEVSLHKVGALALEQKKIKSGNDVFYSVNAHLNPTNICKFRCPICAFSCDSGAEKAYRLTDAEIFEYVNSAVNAGCTELHWVGGVPDDLPYSWYRDMLAEIHRRYPNLRIKAWTAVEILHFATSTGRSVENILAELKSNGLAALPGGGAEIFDEAVRKKLAPKKADAESWLNVHRIAHELGLSTSATMLFGSVELPEHRIDHLIRLRELQNESISHKRPGSFTTFVPLVFHPQGKEFAGLKQLPPHEILRVIAVSRLMLNNFPHIKAYWVTLGIELAQIALGYGADDLDGTVFKERIHHDAGAKVPEFLTETRLRELISETGAVPTRRFG
ncbi:MAG: CofH family radical SAM protein [Thermoguttaceae bacterium]